MLLQLLITTYLFLSINPFPIFHPYPLANDYFDIIYKVQLNSERNMFLNIACKEKDMLSIILTRQLN